MNNAWLGLGGVLIVIVVVAAKWIRQAPKHRAGAKTIGLTDARSEGSHPTANDAAHPRSGLELGPAPAPRAALTQPTVPTVDQFVLQPANSEFDRPASHKDLEAPAAGELATQGSATSEGAALPHLGARGNPHELELPVPDSGATVDSFTDVEALEVVDVYFENDPADDAAVPASAPAVDRSSEAQSPPHVDGAPLGPPAELECATSENVTPDGSPTGAAAALEVPTGGASTEGTKDNTRKVEAAFPAGGILEQARPGHDETATPAALGIENSLTDALKNRCTPAVPPLQPRPVDVESPSTGSRARRYRMQRTSAIRSNTQSRRETPTQGTSRAQQILLRLTLNATGRRLKLSLVPTKAATQPSTVVALGTGLRVELQELQDGFFDEVLIEGLGPALRTGIEWQREGGTDRWLLTGRELFVLAPHESLGGFVLTNRLKLGEQHCVLFAQTMKDAVDSALLAAGSTNHEALAPGSGQPDDWCVYRNVRPSQPVEPEETPEILDALRPLPDVEISLLGGVRLRSQEWLEHFPPTITLLGAEQNTKSLLIDGIPAVFADRSGYTAAGWDAVGQHTVWCAAATRTYAIVAAHRQWHAWQAYRETHEGRPPNKQMATSICGPLVMASDAPLEHVRGILLPAGTGTLLGSEPGQIAVGINAAAADGTRVAFPAFRPVWAVPQAPLRADVASSRVILLGPSGPPAAASVRSILSGRPSDPAVKAWAKIILDCSRKRLRLDGDSAAISLWSAYKTCARQILRGRGW